ncbi:MAG: methyltransferase family protein [Acidimicrobiales bacterium]
MRVSDRSVARAALVLELAYYGITFGWKSWLQYRSTGDTGLRLRRGSSLAARATSAVVAGAVVVGVAGVVAAEPDAETRSSVRVCGLVGILAGLVGTYRSQRDMGRSWRVGVDPHERTDLVTEGSFRCVRNPMFSSMMLVGISAAVAVPNALTIMSATVLCAGLDVEARVVEEPYLRSSLGERYLAYARSTGRFVPWLGRLR